MASGKKSFFIGLFLLLGFVAIAYVAFATYGELNKKKQVQTEIEKLQTEAQQIDQENNLIQERIAYLQSKDYQSLEAKDRLNLQNPGENVVVVKPSVVKIVNTQENSEEGAIPSVANADVTPESNLIKWYAYFFN